MNLSACARERRGNEDTIGGSDRRHHRNRAAANASAPRDDLTDLVVLAGNWEIARWTGTIPHPYSGRSAEGSPHARASRHACPMAPRPSHTRAMAGSPLKRQHKLGIRVDNGSVFAFPYMLRAA
jgi:hypothetical protein